MAKFCSNCGNKVAEKDNVCSNCGNVLKENKEEVLVNSTPVNQQSNNIIVTQTNGLAIAGFVLSLLGLCCCTAGLLFTILGLIFSLCGLGKAKSINGSGRGLAIAGTVISILSLCFAIFWIIAMVTDSFNYVSFFNDITRMF